MMRLIYYIIGLLRGAAFKKRGAFVYPCVGRKYAKLPRNICTHRRGDFKDTSKDGSNWLSVFIVLGSIFISPAFLNDKNLVCKRNIKVKLQSTRKILPTPEVLAKCFGISYDEKDGSILLCSTCLRATYFYKEKRET